MKIVFYVSHFSIRGTEIAIYDYAKYAEELLGHSVAIVAMDGQAVSELQVQRKFQERFDVTMVSDFSQVDAACERLGAEVFYILKSTGDDGRICRTARTAVHAVFATRPHETHGDRYAFVSEWLSQKCSAGEIPFVPHVVWLPAPTGDLRGQLDIPASATVFGCYGGRDSFNIAGARRAVETALTKRSDAVFLFMNIEKFVDHPRAVFLPGTANLESKANFISTCDAMLHAQRIGESFGLACVEFSLMNKPVITYGYSLQRSHIEILGDKALLYWSEHGLLRLLLDFDSRQARQQDWDAYSRTYSPAAVMTKFSEVFLGDEDPVAPRVHPVHNFLERASTARWRLLHSVSGM